MIQGNMTSGNYLVLNSSTNWKNASSKFVKHESSNFHKIYAEALSSTIGVGDILNKQDAKETKQITSTF